MPSSSSSSSSSSSGIELPTQNEPKRLTSTEEHTDPGPLNSSDEPSGSDHEQTATGGFTFRWDQIKYNVTKGLIKKEDVQILKGISGVAQPGRVLAIMGPSGAGKTSLLDVLVGTIKSNKYGGKIWINGNDVDTISGSKKANLISYVGQNDHLYPLLTVRETFTYSARLRLPELNSEEIDQRVEDTINELGLAKVADSKIGNADIRGISGGERRRVSIGIEIVTQPNIIFLDEPTSGLDSFSAFEVVQVLQDLARKGRTVILTIHQPNSSIWDLLDDVCLLVRGNLAYQGPRKLVPKFLSQYGSSVPRNTNPADHAVEVLQQAERNNKIDVLLESFQDFSQKKLQRHNSEEDLSSVEKIPAANKYNFLTQFLVLSQINILNSFRQPEILYVKLFLYTSFSAVLGSAYINSARDDDGDTVSNITGFFIFFLAMLNFTASENIPIFLNNKLIFLREYAAGYYALPVWIIADICVSWCLVAFVSLLGSIPSYFMIGLREDADPFFSFWFLTFTDMIAAQSFVLIISAVLSNPIAANSAANTLFAFQFLFSGFFLARSNIPPWWIWLHYLSIFKYAIEGFIENEFNSNDTYECNDIQASTSEDPDTCTVSSDQVLDSLDTDGLDPRVYAIILLSFAILYRIILYGILKFKGTSRA